MQHAQIGVNVGPMLAGSPEARSLAASHFLAEIFRDLSQVYNYAEVLIWPTIGVVLLIAGLRRTGAVRRDYLLGGAVLLAFGASDYFEAETGNQWWTPWWLLLWKASSVVAMVVILTIAWRRERATKKRLLDSAP